MADIGPGSTRAHPYRKGARASDGPIKAGQSTHGELSKMGLAIHFWCPPINIRALVDPAFIELVHLVFIMQ